MERNLRFFLIPVVAFLVIYLFTAFNNRYASDDFEFLLRFRELGFGGSVKYFYDNWNTRWAAIGLMNLTFMLVNFSDTIFWYHVITITVLWLACFRITSGLLQNASFIKYLVISGTMMASFFYCCFSISDVFFWVNSSAMYLLGCIMFLVALGELLNPTKHIVSFFLVIIAGALLGGMYEPLVMNTMIILLVFMIFRFAYKGIKAINEPAILKSIILLSVLMISFAVSYSGDGHLIRATFLPETSFDYKAIALGKAIIKMFVIYIPSKLILAMALTFPWFIFSSFKSFKFINLKIWLISGALFILLVILSLTPIVFIMSEMGPERAWAQISIYITAYCIVTSVFLGNLFGKRIIRTWIPSIIALSLSGYIIAKGVVAAEKDALYSAAYDERMLYIENTKYSSNDSIIYLVPLPPTSWLHSAELSEKEMHYTNQQFKKYLELEQDIVKLSN